MDLSNIVVLDTETTGLDSESRICEIALIDGDGGTLLHTLIDPQMPIPQSATDIHQISDDSISLANAPVLDSVMPRILNLLEGKELLIYNSEFDIRMLKQSCSDMYHPKVSELTQNTRCVMKEYAEFYGELNHYGDYKWQKLTNALEQQDIDTKPFIAHSALDDCLMTLALARSFME
ncbi:3'-5' exonuclease [Pseudoalteromonas luteoviolacea CPMOR-1]|uniref:3'-5' exonuclease n=1 Tax=Pseudoalteromonas luteoviolacea CPMOR-1 TaxID=1365248 RepID=A0A167HWR3_9GAMM|nr:3'-5' exonuclease [Pseudoalteromonas luteoviolacea]KZN58605.1 3'-5' exonuclease [Pseudoalteromonas luteoviolacea CPMOR-1]